MKVSPSSAFSGSFPWYTSFALHLQRVDPHSFDFQLVANRASGRLIKQQLGLVFEMFFAFWTTRMIANHWKKKLRITIELRHFPRLPLVLMNILDDKCRCTKWLMVDSNTNKAGFDPISTESRKLQTWAWQKFRALDHACVSWYLRIQRTHGTGREATGVSS